MSTSSHPPRAQRREPPSSAATAPLADIDVREELPAPPQRTNHVKDGFLATVSHELRGPIEAITAAASTLQQLTMGDETVDRPIEIILRQCRHISRWADDLLEVAQIGSGELRLDKRLIDLRAAVAEAVQSQRLQIDEHRHQVTMELGTAPILIEADRARLVQVISNLIDNATTYTPKAGRISISLTQTQADVEVAVRDTGIGLGADQLTRIFDPFTQVPASRDSAARRLGLGLTLVRSLAELHGGTVRVVSEGLGRGSCFTVRLPARAVSVVLGPGPS
jgi:signal transduction histidine kinase